MITDDIIDIRVKDAIHETNHQVHAISYEFPYPNGHKWGI